MVNTVQTLRSPTAGNRPVGRAQGELFVNFADKAFGVVDPSNAPLDLLPVRFFSADASYAIGDFVLEARTLYRARVAVTPKAFDATEWDALVNASDLTTALGGYLPLTGGTLTGALNGTIGRFNSSLMAIAGAPIIIAGAGAGTSASLYGMHTDGATPMWLMQMGDYVGGNFMIHAYDDVGTWISTPVTISRLPAPGLTKISANYVAGAERGSTSLGTGSGISWHGTGGNGFTVENSNTAAHVSSFNRVASNGVACNFYQNTAFGCGSITVSGQVSTAYNTTSDTRLKTDARSFDPGPIIDDTEVYNFAWLETQTSDPGKRSYGVMAQEANEVFPDAVTYIDHEDWWGVDYSKYVPLLLQELKTLRARVAALEGGAPAREVNVQPPR